LRILPAFSYNQNKENRFSPSWKWIVGVLSIKNIPKVSFFETRGKFHPKSVALAFVAAAKIVNSWD